jgi:hypothetical protein
MSPSLSGNPLIITAICSCLSPPTLSRMLRVDKQCFHIAGKALYRYLTVITIEDGRHTSPPVEAFYSQKLCPLGDPYYRIKSGVQSATKVALLAMIEVLDITDDAALLITSSHQKLSDDLVAKPHQLRNMKTLVLRSDPRTTPRRMDERSFGDGWAPELLVFIGISKSLELILDRPRDDGAKFNLSWPSVRRLHHISPFQSPTDTVRGDAYAYRRPSLASRPKNLTSYDLYYDVQSPTRHPRIRGDTTLSFESCGLREVPIVRGIDYKRRVWASGLAAAILDSPPNLQTTLWLPNMPARVVRNANFRIQADKWMTHMIHWYSSNYNSYITVASLEKRWGPFLQAERVNREVERMLGEVVDGGAWPAGPVFPTVPTVDRTSEEWRREAAKKRVKAGTERTWWFPDPADSDAWESSDDDDEDDSESGDDDDSDSDSNSGREKYERW